MGYAKVHGSIVYSSIWREPLTVKVVWITMLVIADATGTVNASVGGLAHISGVTRDECEQALNVLLSPDPDSRDGTTGERIQKVAGGWWIINHANYRDKQTREQEQAVIRQERYRQKLKKCDDVTVTGDDVDAASRLSAYASVPSELSVPSEKKGAPAVRPDTVPPDLWSEFLEIRRHKKKLNTARAIARVFKKWEEHGVSVLDGITRCAEKTWAQWDPADDRTFSKKKDSDDRFHQKFVPGMYGEGIQDI